MSRRTRSLRAVLVAATVALGSTSVSQQKPKQKKTEAEIKSGLVVNFCRYLDWSPLPKSETTFEIHIVGKDPLGKAIDELYEKRKVDKHDVAISRFGSWSALAEPHRVRALDCQLLIVAESDPKIVSEILGAIGRRQIVTVGFIPTFLHLGGDIEVFIQENKVRFDVAHDHLKLKGVKVSSKLLKSAERNPASGPRPKEGPR
ncbi:MAG: YfiR family protein [Planctomycetes bacterium]|nr:YfiR family protein [Planctomycetota bacterium]